MPIAPPPNNGLTLFNLSAGSSFPGSPATNDTYFRTDLGVIFYFDGSNWDVLDPVSACRFSAYLSTGTTSVAAGSTVITCDTVLQNVGSNYSNSTGIFTVPFAGDFFFEFYASIAAGSTTGKEYYCFLRDHTASDTALAFSNATYNTAAQNLFMGGSIYIPNMVSGHQIQFLINNGDTVNHNLLGGNAPTTRWGGWCVARN